jgi:hypothetical protein
LSTIHKRKNTNYKTIYHAFKKSPSQKMVSKL